MLEDDLSEQHLMDCGYDGETMIGCDGAFVFAYVEWIIWNNDGLVEKVSDDNARLMIMMIIMIMIMIMTSRPTSESSSKELNLSPN